MNYFYKIVFPKNKNPKFSIFTYHSKEKLNIGDLVQATIRNQKFYGIIVELDKKPTFKTKPLLKLKYKNFLSSKQIELYKYIQSYYFCTHSQALNLFIPKTMPKLSIPEQNSSKVKAKPKPIKFKLNQSQEEVLQEIIKNPKKMHLIHGITGSGKTAIYLKTVDFILQKNSNSQILILVPEISLTPQTIANFTQFFDKNIISIYHSNLKHSQKTIEWTKVYQNQSKIIIGSRSALFLPFKNLSAIIMDEEHDHAYKQDRNPKYHARTIAQWYYKKWGTQFIMGTATPSLETYLASTKNLVHKHEIFHRSQYQKLPTITIVNQKQNYQIISDLLHDKIIEKLKLKEQVLILHNKRGYSSFLTCTDCGEHLQCKNCSITLTLHKTEKSEFLACHYCDSTQQIPMNCQNCESVNIKNIGTGIQKINAELAKLFPSAKIIRADSDTIKGLQSHQELYEKINNAKFDILIGTQMIATGLNIENINLVGVPNADISLSFPDFRAEEKTFQLLTQVAGRAGRGTKQGEVIIQTFNPENKVLQAVKNYDLKLFYETEYQNRKKFNYPPFTKLIKIIGSHKTLKKLNKELQLIENSLQKLKIKHKSAPALIFKKNNKYYHNIIISHLNPEKFIHLLNLPTNWTIDRDPQNTM